MNFWRIKNLMPQQINPKNQIGSQMLEAKLKTTPIGAVFVLLIKAFVVPQSYHQA